MRLSTSEMSDQGSESPPVNTKPTRRRPTHRRFFRRRHPPPPIATPSSFSPSSETPDEPTASDNGTQLDSYSDNFSKSLNASYSTSAPSTYINVAPLPTFSGLPRECPVAHLNRFERVCRANNAFALEVVTRIFPVTLLDDADLWYELAVEPYSEMSWEATKSAFLNAFRRPEFADSARAQLLSLRQRDGETVTSYYLRMQRILKQWPEHGLPESLVRGLFMDGLRDEFHDWVVPRKPETLKDAMGLAMDWEGAQATKVARRRGETGERCGFCDASHGEALCEVRTRMKEEWMRKTREESKEEEERCREERLGRTGSIGRRSLCQCGKHQCWKKYDRSASALTVKTVAASAAEVAPLAPASLAEQ